MGYKVIAPVGDNLKALFVGIKEFPTEMVYLIAPKANNKEAHELAAKLDEFTIKSKILEIDGNIMDGMFRIFGDICSLHDEDDLIVNVATGDRISTCAALSAAFANGLKAFGVMDDMAMMLPIMKLSYYNELSENKLKILKHLSSDDFTSLKQLSEKVSMSISLLSYHINGNYKYKGLKQFRLVELKGEHNNLYIKLSQLGNLLLKGYIKRYDKKK
ncbi:MAG: winged helix-turn-helix domain-containing protein [Nanoarchaeota archaeon]|nr:winged helix-turn-helix domain-containing protein [Nanoarchaeota archaeon]